MAVHHNRDRARPGRGRVRALAALSAYTGLPPTEISALAKPNYSFEKRQREIAKKKQQDEKDARKREAREAAKAAADLDPKPAPPKP